MPARELIVLGTASQVPTRHRHHNGYVLRWDAEAVLFDPGEGSQRQLLLAGVSAHHLTRVCVTHFHGDHALGLPGVIQRIHLDRVPHPVPVHFPAGGRAYFDRLRHATAYHETAEIVPAPVTVGEPTAGTGRAEGANEAEGDGGEVVLAAPPGAPFTLTARRLSHTVETYGYRVVEPDGRRMLPERLAARGIKGPEVGRLRRLGSLRGVSLAEVSVARPGQRFAFIMDTRLCDAVFALASGCDLLVIESTFLDSEADLAAAYGHLTAAQAGQVATECGVRHLVLTHFSQRYQEPDAFAREARAAGFTGELTIARDLARVPFPRRRTGPSDTP